jgi:hypothetical protein
VALRNCSPPKELLHGRGLNLPRVHGADLVFLGIGEHPFRTNCQVEESISDVIHGGDEGPARTREGDRDPKIVGDITREPTRDCKLRRSGSLQPRRDPPGVACHGMCVEFTTARARGGN